MNNHNKRLQVLSKNVLHQNQDPYINCMRLFMKASHLLGKYFDAKLGVYGLTRTQRRIIFGIISRSEPQTPTELSKTIHLTIDTINKAVDSLDKKGLTRSYRSRKDRRVRRVTLTKEGLEMIEKIMPHRHEIFSRVLTYLDIGEIETLSDYILRVLNQISYLTEEAEQKVEPTTPVPIPIEN